MSPNSQSKKDVLTPSEREFVNRVRKSLEQYRLIDMTQNIHRELTGLKMIAESIRQYPSPFKTQTLGGRKRDMATLIDALANATFFTLDMVLPTRTLLGGAFITAKINFFRMLSYLIVEAFRDRKIQISLLNESHLFLSQAVYSKVTEALLSSMICDNKLSYTLRHRAARVALYMWEDRINREMADFFPILEGTWAARQ
ncbi:MAG: hypothetical protein B6244_07460 [Candidatus Cloacimonetes bacterium 4572_55]|nr:MAG: hypothetical protein B6244_07460 [Candidatus Cloacimonetes bacterium 4572_55]